MAEVTIETFKEAARRAATNIDEGTGEDTGLRALVKKILTEGNVEPDPVRAISNAVAEKIANMIWPEFGLEAARAEAVQSIDREVERRKIIKAVKRIMEEQDGR